MIGLVLGETQLGVLIIKKLKTIKKKFVIIDISKKKIFNKNSNSFSLSIGQLGKAITLLRKHKCKEIIFAGKVDTPNFLTTRFDLKALYYLPKIIQSAKKGDASIIKTIISIFKKEGFKILSSTFFNPELLLKKGTHTKVKPNILNKRDMIKGKNIIADLNKRDVGQAIIMRSSHVIAIEDSKGTDDMLRRASYLLKKFPDKNKKHGVLLKFPKKSQDLRVDLPTVGINTIKKCLKIKLKGIVVKANQNIFLDRYKCINLANKKNFFISAI